ncbi:MAG: ABC transporter permease [Chloroflexi bacterium]|nr:ABC transporter permease [Chloroflexota bacterium]
MNNLSDMVWIELRKAIRSRMPLFTALGSLFMPLGIAFLIFVSKNPEISHKLGLISVKANLMAYAATDWPTYLGLFGQIIAAGGFVLFILVISWVFGREFSDGTLKDMLAVPVQRSSILLAKFIVVAVWSAVLTMVILIAGLVMGAIIKLPGGSISVIFQGSARVAITAGLAIAVVMPFALFASVGRGYLLPIGLAILTLMMTNVVAIAGWGENFPWAVPGLYAQGKSYLIPISYWIVLLTGQAGMIGTYLWWMVADQSR